MTALSLDPLYPLKFGVFLTLEPPRARAPRAAPAPLALAPQPPHERSESAQSEAEPSEAEPSEAEPSEAEPSEAEPSEAVRSEAVQSEAVRSEAVRSEAVRSEASPEASPEAAPEAVRSEDAPEAERSSALDPGSPHERSVGESDGTLAEKPPSPRLDSSRSGAATLASRSQPSTSFGGAGDPEPALDILNLEFADLIGRKDAW
jgi:hypothetical protein